MGAGCQNHGAIWTSSNFLVTFRHGLASTVGFTRPFKRAGNADFVTGSAQLAKAFGRIAVLGDDKV